MFMLIASFGIILSAMTATEALAAVKSISVPGWPIIWWGAHSPNATWKASDPGCDDNFSRFDGVPLANVEPVNLGTNSSNLVTDAALTLHGGLDGFYECVGGSCRVWLCNTDAPFSDPNSVRLGSY
jgi:hypothetical protein